MSQTKVLLLFGGESSEHEVSIMSAKNVYAGMNKSEYDVKLCYITKSGSDWLLVGSFEELRGPEILPMLGQGYFKTQEEEFKIDVIFPVLHGENGVEDGAVQGLANLMHIPVVGCGIGASAVCWNKLRTKQILERINIRTTPYVYHRGGRQLPDYNRIVGKGGDIFVKPATAGSSVGVSKVHSIDEFEPAINSALEHSDTVLIEKAITGREFEVAVLATSSEPYRVSGVGEIVPGEEFYNYDDKYSADSNAQVITNAEISDALKEDLQRTARHAFFMLGCEGLARVDFLVSEDETVYVNEVNTMPGFTDISMYPKLLQEAGISYEELIDELIADALD